MKKQKKYEKKEDLNNDPIDDPPSIDLIWQTVLDHSNRLSKIEGTLSSIKWVVATFLPAIISLIIYILTRVGV